MVLLRLPFLCLCCLLIIQCGDDKKLAKPHTPKPPAGELEFTSATQDQKIILKWQWEQGPFLKVKEGEKNKVVVTFLEGRSELLSGVDTVTFYPWMGAHNHGGKGKTTVTRVYDYTFILEDFLFTMAGPWTLEIKATIHGEAIALAIPVDVK
jgi:hypothetical protein